VSGIFVDTLISATGCDSIVTLDLTVNPTLFGTTTAVICDHQAPFVWNGSPYAVSGIFVDTLISATGCDSIVTLDLTVNPTLYGQPPSPSATTRRRLYGTVITIQERNFHRYVDLSHRLRLDRNP
jgi:hypothetical protein